jgi:hypothetical protein
MCWRQSGEGVAAEKALQPGPTCNHGRVRPATRSLLCISLGRRSDLGVAACTEARDQEAHRDSKEQRQWNCPRVSRVAQDAEEGRSTRGEQVANSLRHGRKPGSVLGVGRPQRKERERQAEARSIPNRRASRGATDESSPNAKSGRVVSKPATPLDMPVVRADLANQGRHGGECRA